MKKQKKRGRPQIPEDKQLVTFSVRLLPSEHETYSKVASELGIPLSGWIRMTLRKAAKL